MTTGVRHKATRFLSGARTSFAHPLPPDHLPHRWLSKSLRPRSAHLRRIPVAVGHRTAMSLCRAALQRCGPLARHYLTKSPLSHLNRNGKCTETILLSCRLSSFIILQMNI